MTERCYRVESIARPGDVYVVRWDTSEGEPTEEDLRAAAELLDHLTAEVIGDGTEL